jgi:di/tricarboxylate transporter
MTWQAWLTVGTLVAAFGVMSTDRVSPDKVMVAALSLLILGGVVSAERALIGFSNQGMLTVALLFVVAAAIRRSGAFGALGQRLLGRPRTVRGAQLRLMAPVAAMSAFLNNTPLVAILVPEVRDWARARGIAPSRLLLLLSYGAIMGGLCTLIGTSTNLVVVGLLTESGLPGLPFFEVAKIGVPFALAGILFCVLFGPQLLPDRPIGDMPLADPLSFTGGFAVVDGGPLVGKRLRDVRAPDLPALNPFEIERDGQVVPAPREDEVLRAGDRLLVSAAVAEVQALQRIPGLVPLTELAFAPAAGDRNRTLAQLVVSPTCPLVGQVVGQGSFRRHYDAAIVAIARNGERVVPRAAGGWRLGAGDTLLVEVSDDFLALHRTNPDFYLVTNHGRIEPVKRWYRWFSLCVFLAMIGCAASGLLSTFEAVLGASLVLLGSGVITWRQAQADVNWPVLLLIATAFGLSGALIDSGAAAQIGHAVVSAGGGDPWTTLAVIYLVTVVTTELVSNNAAAAIMLPISLSTAAELGTSHMPFVMALMVGASAGFASPIGYQTHLIVFGPGGYRFSDFFRIGIPLGLVLACVVIGLVPLIWPF